jgi:hypothetical protein
LLALCSPQPVRDTLAQASTLVLAAGAIRPSAAPLMNALLRRAGAGD